MSSLVHTFHLEDLLGDNLFDVICVLRNMAKKRAPRDSLVIGGYGIDLLLGRLAKGRERNRKIGKSRQNRAKCR